MSNKKSKLESMLAGESSKMQWCERGKEERRIQHKKKSTCIKIDDALPSRSALSILRDGKQPAIVPCPS